MSAVLECMARRDKWMLITPHPPARASFHQRVLEKYGCLHCRVFPLYAQTHSHTSVVSQARCMLSLIFPFILRHVDSTGRLAWSVVHWHRMKGAPSCRALDCSIIVSDPLASTQGHCCQPRQGNQGVPFACAAPRMLNTSPCLSIRLG